MGITLLAEGGQIATGTGPAPEWERRGAEPTMTSMIEYLQPGEFVDSDHRDVVAFAGRVVGDAGTDRDKAVRLFYAVRDGWRYDPYNLAPGPEANRASSVLAQSPVGA